MFIHIQIYSLLLVTSKTSLFPNINSNLTYVVMVTKDALNCIMEQCFLMSKGGKDVTCTA